MFRAQTSNGWCIEWPYCIIKSLSTSTVGWLVLQTKANELQKKPILQECQCKKWRLFYDFLPSGIIFSPVGFCNCELLAATCLRFLVVCGCHWTWTGRKNHTTAGIIFFLANLLYTWIWLFFLKTGSLITQIKSVWSSNQQWLVHWVTLLHNKKSQHCWLTCIADQGKWIAKKTNIARVPV